MVFLDKISEKLTINRHFSDICSKITLFNRFTKEVTTLSNLQDTSDSSFFYVFEGLDLSGLIDGEYYITLYDENDKIIENMIGVCGDYTRTITSYQKQNNDTIVYERS